MQSKCPVCGNKKSRFVKEQEAKGFLSNLGIKTPFSKIPLLHILFSMYTCIKNTNFKQRIINQWNCE